jgi:2'-5' RNA ligase
VPQPTTWPEVDTFESHWRWRPDWTQDRTCLYWYLTFEDHPDAAAVAARAVGRLGELPGVDRVPPRWLHLTLCDIGFLDEIESGQLERLVEEVAGALSRQQPLSLTLGPVLPFSDSVTLAAEPADQLAGLWCRVAAAMKSVGVEPRHHPVEHFRPHVTLGYVNQRVESHRVVAALGDPWASQGVTVDRLTLAAVGRRDGHYQWDCGAVIPFGDNGASRSTGSESTP